MVLRKFILQTKTPARMEASYRVAHLRLRGDPRPKVERYEIKALWASGILKLR